MPIDELTGRHWPFQLPHEMRVNPRMTALPGRGFYVCSSAPGAGKSFIVLGLVDTLYRHANKVGFYRPFVNLADPELDPEVLMLRELYGLDEAVCCGSFGVAQATRSVAAGRGEEIFAEAFARFSKMASQCDVVLVDGSDLRGHDSALEFALNAHLANTLGLPVVGVVGASGMGTMDTVEAVDATRRQLSSFHCSVLAVMANRAGDDSSVATRKTLQKRVSGLPVYVLPEAAAIACPTVSEVSLSLELLQIGGIPDLDRDVRAFNVAAATVGNFLKNLVAGDLVIVPGDRVDVIVASLACGLMPGFPVPSGMVLTNGLPPHPSVLPMLVRAPFPVFIDRHDIYGTVQNVAGVRAEIYAGRRRQAAALEIWAKYVDQDELMERLSLTPRRRDDNPGSFQQHR